LVQRIFVHKVSLASNHYSLIVYPATISPNLLELLSYWSEITTACDIMPSQSQGERSREFIIPNSAYPCLVSSREARNHLHRQPSFARARKPPRKLHRQKPSERDRYFTSGSVYRCDYIDRLCPAVSLCRRISKRKNSTQIYARFETKMWFRATYNDGVLCSKGRMRFFQSGANLV